MKSRLCALLVVFGVWSSDVVGFEENTLEMNRGEIPTIVCSGNMAIANLNLNGQGNVIVARPGERIFSTVNFSCNTECVNMHSLNQIIIGYEKLGPRKCIFNELGYRCGGDRITSFFLEAPREPGVYLVQCSLEQEHSPIEAMQNWDRSREVKLTIGRVIVN